MIIGTTSYTTERWYVITLKLYWVLVERLCVTETSSVP